uniref:Uncharacterized protein n=1 Tax=Arundo donax TaxID=35708 RepID=A0A0A8Z6Y6_ARUDO
MLALYHEEIDPSCVLMLAWLSQ